MKKDFLSPEQPLFKTAASVTFIPCLTQFPIAHIPITRIFEVVQTIIGVSAVTDFKEIQPNS